MKESLERLTESQEAAQCTQTAGSGPPCQAGPRPKRESLGLAESALGVRRPNPQS